ncbi:MAG: hypothetical protein HYR55_09645 [Acidobacteria bacterium]|nr:hypothetical protein [Acidobacteriota bacterium]MBI3656746.1 hypothetical protein [Acidobacteriota bacterium]
MKRYSLVFLCMFCAGLSIAFAQSNTYYFPQVANGPYPGGSYKTTMILVNSGTAAVTLTVRVTDNSGNPISMFPGLDSGSFPLSGGSSRVVQSNGLGELTSGAASIVATGGPIGATAIFSQFDDSGRLQTEAGVNSAPLMRSFTMPVDTSGTYNTGVAFYKPGSGIANITLKLFDEGGAPKGEKRLPLGQNGHMAAYVTSIFEPLIGFNRGSLVVTSDNDISAVALRQGSGVGPVITTLPVSTPQTSFNFPQIANGVYPGGGYKTSLILVNSGMTAADVTVALTGDDGRPISMFPDLVSGRDNIPPGATKVYISNGVGTVTSGAAAISSTNPIVAALIFSLYDESWNLQTEAGVSAAPSMQNLTIPVDLLQPFNTGVAFFKLGAGTANITLRLYDSSGSRRGERVIPLGAGAHRADFVDTLFPSVVGFERGSLSIVSTGNVAAVALRFGQGTVPVYTTLPVIDGAFTGGGGGGSSFAGSFDGEFTVEGVSGPAGKLTMVIRQNGDMVTGRLGQDIGDGGCIRSYEFTATAGGSSIQARTTPLDAVSPEMNLSATISGDERRLSGSFSVRGCGGTPIRGQFDLPKVTGTNPPDLNGTFLGGVWNESDPPERAFVSMSGTLNGRNYVVDRIIVTTLIGLVEGTATGRLNEAGDRIENLVISLSTPVGPLVLRGEVSASADGKVIFGGLQTGPGEILPLKGSTFLRK